MSKKRDRYMISHSKPWIMRKDRDAVDRVMRSGMLVPGSRVAAFESAVAGYIGVRKAIAVRNGTAALVLALRALDVGPGDEVIIPTYVCYNVAEAVSQVGAKTVLCDVGPFWNMTADTAAKAISRRTKAIILVHLFGVAADTIAFRKFGIPVIEDCTQAFGAAIRGKKVGSLGAAGVFSFNATKCFTTGEGGMVVTSSKQVAKTITSTYTNDIFFSSITDMQAALGLSQMMRYDTMLTRRRDIASRYLKALPERLTSKMESVNRNTIFFRFLIYANCGFDRAYKKFERRGISVRRGVDELLHRKFGMGDGRFPNASELYRNTISLPIYPAMTGKEQGTIIEACRAIFGDK